VHIKDYYQAFDLFVCPSRAEPFGFVLLEALDAGVPIAATDALGPAEVLSRYPGSLFPVADVAALADLLRYYHSARLPKSPQDLSPYALDLVAAQTEAAYQEIIASKRPPID
jgi:glycosyltransferase involved in cell wall biosynthesis